MGFCDLRLSCWDFHFFASGPPTNYPKMAHFALTGASPDVKKFQKSMKNLFFANGLKSVLGGQICNLNTFLSLKHHFLSTFVTWKQFLTTFWKASRAHQKCDFEPSWCHWDRNCLKNDDFYLISEWWGTKSFDVCHTIFMRLKEHV